MTEDPPPSEGLPNFTSRPHRTRQRRLQQQNTVMGVGRADTNRRCKLFLPTIPDHATTPMEGRNQPTDGREEPTHTDGGRSQHRREEGDKLKEGRKELTPVPPGGGGGGRTWALCCPRSQHQSRSPTIHDSAIRRHNTSSPDIRRRRCSPSKTEPTRRPNPCRAGTHQPRRKQLVSRVSRGETRTKEKTTTDDLERLMTAIRRARDDKIVHHIHHIMSAKPSQHRHRHRRITSPAPRIIPPNRHPHITSPHRTDCNTRTTTPGTHSTVTITSSKIEPETDPTPTA